ncbi:MAG: DUF3472 domain-containing protein [Flavobacteriaceae bacterium]
MVSSEFGNEGSGYQSYKIFNWKAGSTYWFLLKGEPVENNSTDFSAYFYAPESGQWELIATFRRPFTTTYLRGLYSFLENFVTETGYISREVDFANQWVYDTEGNWHELTKPKFTADNTAIKGARLGYVGGVNDKAFFLRNCGFFNETTAIDSFHNRKGDGIAPSIDFVPLRHFLIFLRSFFCQFTHSHPLF